MPLATRFIVHPHRLDSLKANGIFPSLVTIQLNTPTRTTSGRQVDTWSVFMGLADVACRVMPITASTQRLPQYAVENTTHELLLSGSYPAISDLHRATVTGDAAGTYDITGAETDGNASITRVFMRLVKVGT